MSRINAALILHYAETDERVNAGRPGHEAALQDHGKTCKAHVNPGTGHDFHNDSTPRYDESAVERAWGRTLGWFERRVA